MKVFASTEGLSTQKWSSQLSPIYSKIFLRRIQMTKCAKTKWVGAVVLSLAAFGGTLALAQGDPPRAFDAATAAVRGPGAPGRGGLLGDSSPTNNPRPRPGTKANPPAHQRR